MGFFSKLFGEDDGPPQQAEAPKPPPAPPPRRDKDKDRDKEAAAAANESASEKSAPPAAEREPPRAPALRSPPPPPPPPPLGAAAPVPPPPAAALPVPPPPAAAPPPPPPAGIAKGEDAGKAAAAPPARGGRSRAAKPAAPPPAAGKPAGTVKVGGAATVKRSSNATMRGMPAVAPPPVTNERAFDPTLAASEAATLDESAPSTLVRAEVSDDAVTLELAVAKLAPLARAVVDGTLGREPANAAEGSALEPASEGEPESAAAVGHDTLDTAVDAAVDRLFDAQDVRQTMKDEVTLAAEREADQRAAAATFRELVAGGSAQLRELVFQLSVGRTPRHWAAACRPVIAPFLDGARQIELKELAGALADLDAALELAAGENGPYVSAQGCASIDEAYAALAAQLPEAFSVSGDGDNRRLLLLESLLLQVPALYRRTLNKLYGAGLGSLEQLSGASPEEIAAVAGIDHSVASAITERVQRFERERSRWNPGELRATVHDQLRVAIARLNQLQDQFERAEQEEAAERKRAARRARDSASHELDLLLSELGELSLIEDLKRCAVHAKIRRVEGYLEQAQAAQ